MNATVSWLGALGVSLFLATPGLRAQSLLHDIHPGSAGSLPSATFSDRGRVVFSADDGVFGSEPWASDGSAAGTQRLADVQPGAASSTLSPFVAWQNEVWFSANTGLWRSDGTAAGTQKVLGVPIGELHAVGGLLYFGGPQFGLYTTDSTPAGTVLVRVFNRNFYPAGPSKFVSRSGKVYFVASEGIGALTGLWESAGTAASTRLVVSSPGSFGKVPIGDVVADTNAVYVVATSFTNDLWRVDDAGATRLGTFSVLPPAHLTPMLGSVFFVARDSTGSELWVTDGTVGGTRRFLDIHAGSASSDPSDLLAVNGHLFFVADDGVYGRELWVSDGTAAGTHMVVDAIPGAVGSTPTSLRRAGLGTHIVYAALDANGGNEVWISDGTAAATRMIADVVPGPIGSNPSGFANAGTTLLFAAQDSALGVELFSMPLSLVGTSLVEAFGTGCAGTGGLVPAMGATGAATLGNGSFTLTLRQARAQSATGMFVSAALAPAPLPGGCQLLTGTPITTLPGSTDGLGQWDQPLPVPNASGLLGAELVLQAAVADPAGAFLGLLAFSDGLRILIGS